MRAATKALFTRSTLSPLVVPSVVEFDAAGTGGISPSPNPVTWTHYVNGNRLLIPFQFFTTVGFTATTKIGSVEVTSSIVPSTNWYSSGGFFGYYGCYELADPPQGFQTLTQTFIGGAPYNWTSNSFTYRNVASLGTPATLVVVGPNVTRTGVTASDRGMFFNAFSTLSSVANARFTNYSHTSRWNQPLTTSSLAMVAGDAADRGSDVTFGATIPDADYVFGYTIPMLPVA